MEYAKLLLTTISTIAFAAACSAYALYVALRHVKAIGWVATGVAWLGLGINTVALVLHGMQEGRLPLTSGFDFAMLFAWGTVLAYLVIEILTGQRTLGGIPLLLAVGLHLYARHIFGSQPQVDLPPALKNPFWLTVHVIVAIVAYGVLAVSFATAIMYLLRRWGDKRSWECLTGRIPEQKWLDVVTYRVVGFAFPFLTLVVITGAIWADTAWGRPWQWDPKETLSLVSWAFYALYLHARLLTGWRGLGTAICAIVGFLAVLFCYIGPNYLPGLHSYQMD
ncbi:MAG: c-type cytochrome biogenesis protein CcsB [Armatimonadota bacterium]